PAAHGVPGALPQSGPAQGCRRQLGARPHPEAAAPDARASYPGGTCEELGDQEGGGPRSVREHRHHALHEDGGEQRAAGPHLHVRRPEGRRDRSAEVGGEGPMAPENSFDIACKIEMQEVTNGLDQARREIATRYDLKGAKCDIKLEKTDITVTAPDDMKLKAVVDIL